MAVNEEQAWATERVWHYLTIPANASRVAQLTGTRARIRFLTLAPVLQNNTTK
jgi:hypothetical protein